MRKSYENIFFLIILCILILSGCKDISAVESKNNNQLKKNEVVKKDREIKVIKSKLRKVPKIGDSAQKEWDEAKRIYDNIDWSGNSEFTDEEVKARKVYAEVLEGPWDVIGNGDCWYNGGGPYKVTSSSTLERTYEIDYDAQNAHDSDLRTAWIEGEKGYGIGEYIEYKFKPNSPRVTMIKIYNGYMKSKKAWRENSRVKELKMFVNDEPYAILKLEDALALQTFEIEPMQSMIEDKDLVLKFEIMDVYKGSKYRDVAISELYFDGLDVLCFATGTMVKLSNGLQKPIEKLKINDSILSYNFSENKVEVVKILGMKSKIHNNLIKLEFNNFNVISTNDHPYYVKGKGWCSYSPNKTLIYKNIRNVNKLSNGDKIVFLNDKNEMDAIKLLKISRLNEAEKTFTITNLSKNKSFFVEGLLVGIEEIGN